MSEIRLIFIRHGEAANAWGDHPDPNLSENGLYQAKKLVNHKRLLNLQNYFFISSPKLRARETAKPLAKKFNKDVIINKAFTEIPSKDIDLSEKQKWLKKILNTKKEELPKYIKSWKDNIFDQLMNIKNHSVIFTHFMVMNSIASNLKNSETLLCFYPDYTSILEIVIDNKKIQSFFIENNKKTYINL